MSTLDFIEKKKISQLLNNGGYVLDFTNATYGQFILEKTDYDLYAKYGMSKGKNLEAIVSNESDIIVGKLLLELLRYMQTFNLVNDNNRALFNECAEIGNRLIGRKSTPSASAPTKTETPKPSFDFSKYLSELIALSTSKDTPQARGHAFEKYLNTLFDASGLEPRGAFKIIGEQIDGSFVLKDEVYLLEAKWTSKKINRADLINFKDKVSNKSTFTRGLFISYSGYTDEALDSLSKGTRINIVLMDVQDLVVSMERNIPLGEVIWKKVRALAEEGNFNKNVFEM
ncbi:MAG: restriction endonuclease [Fibromonadaceae bacterium]|jgi:hypothetical protein|nr:restriction endonuclease [Fibromonadaceae bacterium]